MTEQLPDTVELEGKTWFTWDTPLDGYFIERGMDTAIVDREFLCRPAIAVMSQVGWWRADYSESNV